jgi:ABC-type methionine transport system permease subunit
MMSGPRPSRGGSVSRVMARDLAMIVGAFVLASALAGALGAPNLGTAMSFGQMAFAASVVFVMLKR